MIDTNIAVAAKPYLQPGERIVWTGRPAGGLRFTSYDIFLVPFSIIWTGGVGVAFSASLMGALSGQIVSPLLILVPTFMLLVGLYLVFGRFVIDARIRAATLYALTDRRAILLRRWFGERLSARPLDGQVRLSRRGGGRGTLEFGPPNPFRAFGGGGFWMSSLTDQVVFDGVPDVMDVYALAMAPKT